MIGGADATAGEWPWQAKLETKKWGFTCGGSLITPTWVMTAAHCISDNDPSVYSVTLGDLNRKKKDGTEQKFSVKRVVVHPDYNSPFPVNNDIALIELTRPVIKTLFVNTVCLPRESEVVSPGTKCYISGLLKNVIIFVISLSKNAIVLFAKDTKQNLIIDVAVIVLRLGTDESSWDISHSFAASCFTCCI